MAGTGIVLIAFGSSLPFNREVLRKHRDSLSAKGYNVYIGFIGREIPSVTDALSKAEKDGLDGLVIIPYLIADGEMSLERIPDILGIPHRYGDYRVFINDREINLRYTEPIGMTPEAAMSIIDIVRRHRPDNDTAIVLVGHGSKEPYNVIMARSVANRLTEEKYQNVFIGFNEFCKPTIEESMSAVAKSRCNKVLVVPLLIASGIHLTEDIPDALGLPRNTSCGTTDKFGRALNIEITETIGGELALDGAAVRRINGKG
jgi:sirohydrochlorin ferrochelatase